MTGSSGHFFDIKSFEHLQPRTLVLVIGTLAAAVNIFFGPSRDDTFVLLLVPAAIMAVVLVGGWLAGIICGAVSVLAGLVQGSDLYQIGVYAVAAIVGGEMLRRGVKPMAIALLHTVCNAGVNWRLLGGPVSVSVEEITAAALVVSCVNVTAATAVLTVMPRRSAMFPPRCRVRWDHIVFVLTPGMLSVAAIGLAVATRTEAFVNGVGWGVDTSWRVGGLVAAACLTNLALTSRLNAIARRAFRRFWTAQRSKRRGGRPLPGELPVEVAPYLIGLSREMNRLRRRVALHDKEKAELRAQIQRLMQEVADSRVRLETSSAEIQKLTRTTERARARYHVLMDQTPDVTLFADSEGVIQSVSRSAIRMLGYQPVELKGKKLDVLIPEGRSSGHPLAVSEKQPKQGAVSLMDTFVRSQGGKEKAVAALVRAFPIHGSYQYAIQLRDTGRMKKALATLEQAKQLTQSAHRSRDLFIAAMSHELRTPLHGLIATLDMMRLDESRTPELRQRLAIARMSARALLKIANDVLDLTRIDSGHFTLEQQPFSLTTTIEEIIDESRARAESADLTLTSRILDKLPPAFMGDPARLKQILHNLVSNALKFTHTGGVTLQVRYDGKHCVIDVIDTGEGIPADKRDSIFEPFVQVESNKRRQSGGTGLGLPISRRLAEAMGGTLTLLRSDSRGSTFRLSVPLPVSKVLPPSEQSQRVFRNPRGRILVVEDNAANRYVVEALLGNLECPATIVESGVEAIEVLSRFEFDLILMDCQMPGLDGFETTRRIRQMLSRHVPIIAMTANAMPEDQRECLAAGMDDFLPKPFGCQALHTVLCKWLEPASAAKRDADELEAKAASLPVLDVAVFNELRQSLQWKQEPLRRICTTFTDSAQQAIAALQGTAGERIDRRAVRRHLHTLLGSAGMVGARQTEYIARRIQGTLQSHRLSENDAALELLKTSLKRFQVEFEEHLQSGAQGSMAAASHMKH